jgi:hypothetical protein
MRILQGFLMVMGALAVLAIIALIVGYVLAILTPDIRTSIRPVVLSSEAVDSFNKKMADFRTNMRKVNAGSGPTDITLSLTEEEVNSMIVMSLAEGTIPAKEILVNFNDGFLVLYSSWTFNMFPVKTGIVGSFDVEDKKPKFMLSSFFLGKLPLPSSFNTSVQDIINIVVHLNPLSGSIKFNYKEITISEGTLKLVGTVERLNSPDSAAK